MTTPEMQDPSESAESSNGPRVLPGANGADLSRPRIVTPPTCSIVKPATTLNVDELRFDLTQLENNTTAAPLAIPVDKPGEFEWFRVHPNPAFRPAMFAIEFEPPGTRSRELHIIHPSMAHVFAGTSAAPHVLYVLMNRVGGLRIVEVKQPGPDGKWNEWHRTRQLALEKGLSGWVRMWSNRAAGRYEFQPAPISYPDPLWPDLSVGDLLQIGFGDLGRIIAGMDHPVVKVLRGEL